MAYSWCYHWISWVRSQENKASLSWLSMISSHSLPLTMRELIRSVVCWTGERYKGIRNHLGFQNGAWDEWGGHFFNLFQDTPRIFLPTVRWDRITRFSSMKGNTPSPLHPTGRKEMSGRVRSYCGLFIVCFTVEQSCLTTLIFMYGICVSPFLRSVSVC